MPQRDHASCRPKRLSGRVVESNSRAMLRQGAMPALPKVYGGSRQFRVGLISESGDAAIAIAQFAKTI